MKEQTRYSRQLALPEIREKGQERLKSSKVLIVGAGGLGSPVALYLAAAGVGTLGIMDYDVVSASNLNRQLLYEERDLGKWKVEAAVEKIKRFNSEVQVNAYTEQVRIDNLPSIRDIISKYDIVVDACDNMATRYMISDITQELSIPFVYGAMEGFCGYVSVFNDNEDTKRFRNLWPEENLQTTSAIPAIGVTAGVIGSLQANEVIKWICGFGERLSGKLLTVDLCSMEFHTLIL